MENRVSRAGEYFFFRSDEYSSPLVLADDAVVKFVDIVGCTTQSLDASGCAALVTVSAYTCGIMASADVSSCPLLSRVDLSDNNGLAALSVGGCPFLVTVVASGCGLPESEVDGVLAALDAAGASNGTVDLSLGTNAIPSAAGLTSKANLEGKGWTVTVNS